MTRINKKLLRKVAIGSFVTTVVIGVGMLASTLSVYQCVNDGGFGSQASCPALDRANTITHVGFVAINLAWIIFLISIGMYIYYSLKHKE